MFKALKDYFSEFGILKTASREFWIVNFINFFDGIAYFSMITILSIYLTQNIGFSDIESGTWVGVFTLAISIIIMFVGFITDSLGVKKSLMIGIVILGLGRVFMGVIPSINFLQEFLPEKTAVSIIEYRKTNGDFKSIDDLKKVNGISETIFEKNKKYIDVKDFDPNANKKSEEEVNITTININKAEAKDLMTLRSAEVPKKVFVITLLLIMAFGTSMMSPVISAGLRKYTTKKNRGTGFNMFYLLMNIGAIIAGFAVDFFRLNFKEWGFIDNVDTGNFYIFNFGFAMSIITVVLVLFIRPKFEEIDPDDPHEQNRATEKKNPLAIFVEVIKEPTFWRFMLLMLLLLGVRLVFTHQFLVMPKYYTRVLSADAPIGLLNMINPAIIVVGLIIIMPIINKFDIFKTIIVGTAISAFSLVILVVPPQWFVGLPFITDLYSAYYFMILVQIVVFAVGEVIWSPRFYEYTASIAPRGREGSYMAMSAIPFFAAKFINGAISGWLLKSYCFDGIMPKIEKGEISFMDSPEFMWLIYTVLAVSSPFLVLMLKNVINPPKKDEPKIDLNKEAA